MWAHHGRSYGAEVNTSDRPIEPTTSGSVVGHARISRYEIRVRGHLGPHLAVCFDGLELAAQDDGTTLIRGPVVDQAALHGLLHRLRDLGIPLVSLAELPAEAPTSPTDLQNHPEPQNQPGPNNPPGATS